MPWPLPSGEAERLALAKGYPYEAPASSYLFRQGESDVSAPAVWPAGSFQGRFPVIAHGSNRAPAQLTRKYGPPQEARRPETYRPETCQPEAAARSIDAVFPDDIPVTLARLHDYEVVYSAHMTRYGAVAANLQHAPGAAVEIFVTWLNEGQLRRMHETELGAEIYRFGRLQGVRLEQPADPLPSLDSVFVYLSSAGCLRVEDQPAALAAIPAAKRRFPALSQLEALEAVRRRLQPDLALDDFILLVIADSAVRREVISTLRADAVALEAPHFQQLDPAVTPASLA